MASDTKNVKLGVCSVTFDGVDLGYTKGGVEVEVKTETKEVMVDQFGNSPVNDIILGRTCTSKVPLAETTLDNLLRIMPGAQMVATGAAKATGTVTFATTAPAANDAVVVNGVPFTFKASPTGPHDMAVPASINAAALALRDAINNSIDPRVSTLTASAAAGVTTLTADDSGTAGNAITLAKTNGANITLSGATLTGGLDASKRKVNVPNAVGLSLLDIAKKLVLHPQSRPADDRSEDYTIPLAMTAGDMTFAYKLDEERIFNCTFKAYPSAATRLLFVVGDETAA